MTQLDNCCLGELESAINPAVLAHFSASSISTWQWRRVTATVEGAKVDCGFGIHLQHFKVIILQLKHHLQNNLPFSGIHFASPPVKTAVGGNIFGNCFGLLTNRMKRKHIKNEKVNFLRLCCWSQIHCKRHNAIASHAEALKGKPAKRCD